MIVQNILIGILSICCAILSSVVAFGFMLVFNDDKSRHGFSVVMQRLFCCTMCIVFLSIAMVFYLFGFIDRLL